ncbi:hypothetical protein K435DRAFT_59181 [Dendrothele bispora CBS 962.96]|uniref:Uncharacterized protein n=1 Tax=Dendrothele bispora (strain CBS 962.96) TaxID=1314807 RepID=A0A4S8M5Z1_DENBC|nr:hypothetical protein K435DRAFT_59181 [Dendrothele bispora CBS 962.96]
MTGLHGNATDPSLQPSPPSREPTFLVPDQSSPGLFGPRTPESAVFTHPPIPPIDTEDAGNFSSRPLPRRGSRTQQRPQALSRTYSQGQRSPPDFVHPPLDREDTQSAISSRPSPSHGAQSQTRTLPPRSATLTRPSIDLEDTQHLISRPPHRASGVSQSHSQGQALPLQSTAFTHPPIDTEDTQQFVSRSSGSYQRQSQNHHYNTAYRDVPEQYLARQARSGGSPEDEYGDEQLSSYTRTLSI